MVEVVSLLHRPAAELKPLLDPLLETGDRIIDNGSSLIVKTTPDRLESIKGLIKQLDTQASNLIITVLQNTHRTASELNAASGINDTANAIRMHGMNADTRDISSDQISQSLRTLEGHSAYIKTGKVKAIQNMSVYGAINSSRSPQVTGTTPINAQQPNAQLPNGYPLISTNTQMQEADSGFTVTPRLSGQQVILDIAPWSDRFHQGNNLERQSVHTSLRANLGEWIEIAGDNTSNQPQRGFNTFNHSTLENNLRILIKVDKAD